MRQSARSHFARRERWRTVATPASGVCASRTAGQRSGAHWVLASTLALSFVAPDVAQNHRVAATQVERGVTTFFASLFEIISLQIHLTSKHTALSTRRYTSPAAREHVGDRVHLSLYPTGLSSSHTWHGHSGQQDKQLAVVCKSMGEAYAHSGAVAKPAARTPPADLASSR